MKRFGTHPDELLSASLSGDLTDLERRELDAHLLACPECRDTLDAFTLQRQLLSQMSEVPAPRDLGARVRSGIEAGRFGPWWRRPGGLLALGTSLATVAAAVLAVIVLTRPSGPPVGTTSSLPSSSPTASVSAAPSQQASGPASPSQEPVALGMRPGDLIYPALRGTSVQDQHFTIENDANGESIAARTPTGQLDSAALSPDGRWFAYRAPMGLSGADAVAVVHLADGTTTELGRTEALSPFAYRLAWSPDGRYLAYTISPVDPNQLTPIDPAAPGAAEAFLFDTRTGTTAQLTKTGNVYVAGWGAMLDGQETLWLSFGAETPRSVAYRFVADAGIPAIEAANPVATADGVFLPLPSPDGAKALYWMGTMRHEDAGWTFVTDGLPYLTETSAGGLPSFTSGKPLFADLAVTGPSDTFQTGQLGWSADSDTFVFWGGTWSGLQQPTGYPDERTIYVGKASAGGQLTQKSGIGFGLKESEGVVAVALSADGGSAAVTLRREIGGELASPSASLWLLDLATGEKKDVAAGGSTPPWYGPGDFLSGATGP